MNDEIDELIFIPTEEDKERISKLCDKCIDVLSELKTIPEKAFALQMLIKSFEDVANVKLTAIMENNEDV